MHHVHPDGRAPGRENLLAAGVEYDEFVAEGMSEDAAMLIAYEAGADAHRRGRNATPRWWSSSTRAGAGWRRRSSRACGSVRRSSTPKGVSRLYEGRIRRRDMVFLVASAHRGDGRMIYASHSLHVFINGFRLVFRDTWDRVASWF